MSEKEVSLLSTYLQTVLDEKASDLHLTVGSPPQIRVDGELKSLGDQILVPDVCERLCFSSLSKKQIEQFKADQEIDLAIDFMGRARFRVNLSFQKDSVSGAFRYISSIIPSHESLGVPSAAMRLTMLPRGLVLVTGPTGSGKSTTLAAMIHEINLTRSEHIITIEDPIEYVHTSKKSLVAQREVERDTHSFQAALKRILRQDPDVVLIGEMRDLETIAAAITVSETGHLVFATLHTNSAVESINRIIDVFPPHQQSQVRTQLSFILQGILTQQLVPRVNGGRSLAMEILLPNLGIRNLIREDKVHQIYASMQMGQEKSHMQTMNQALYQLFKAGTISKENCRSYATDMEEMRRLLGE